MESAINADSGLEKFKAMCEKGLAYHMIFIDVKMPKKDGVELTKEIRAYEKLKNYKPCYICGMKTDDDNPDDAQYLEAGMNDVCMKPIKPDIFKKILGDRLETIEGKPKPSLKFHDEIFLLGVDDNIMNLTTLSRQKTKVPYKMESSKSAEDALEKIKKQAEKGFRYHLVFMDVVMPKENGLVATKKIRDWEKSNGFENLTYICGMRVHDDDILENQCLESGMNDVCIKPVKPDVFNHIFDNRLKQIESKH